MVIDSGAVPLFVELLSNPVADVKEQVREIFQCMRYLANMVRQLVGSIILISRDVTGCVGIG